MLFKYIEDQENNDPDAIEIREFAQKWIDRSAEDPFREVASQDRKYRGCEFCFQVGPIYLIIQLVRGPRGGLIEQIEYLDTQVPWPHQCLFSSSLRGIGNLIDLIQLSDKIKSMGKKANPYPLLKETLQAECDTLIHMPLDKALIKIRNWRPMSESVRTFTYGLFETDRSRH